ncbi:stage III sporulation protein AA (mutants block sporulation after engulfment) [Oceanobacillus iheyensis HTE831]|uniref:Stage III sporulation protein AA (Mutants block sporulation after engulfment) n=1 Tax=Oceanobacillus iheyensis (strain DSM 14371 / CIP 107618 / JCM 11309 / KCTC 3954 / HTE831) TaxID=221109 RepID=Q8EQ29_OCEIH|nr:stage III sporulation protein AA [Oceanobacillus iheyensis]BAC13850.1 stage III sporulation protein AA (mutants block sporulation after engulfment) [Oceanobacillus iheyensis HTE831]
MDKILRLFPIHLQQRIKEKIIHNEEKLQEIRIRIGRPIELIFDKEAIWLKDTIPQKNDGNYLLNQISEYSLYRMEDELRSGYITIEGGHRVGIAGRVNTSGKDVKALQHISCFNIRIAKEKRNAAIDVFAYINYNNYYFNTMVIGPPQSGKTTIIRDLTRMIATIDQPMNRSKKVGIVDERSEIAASLQGIPQHDVGTRTDIMDACPKAEGMMMLVRSMSPDIIVVDEIGTDHDVEALLEAIHTGVTIICTAHANQWDDLNKRPSMKRLIEQQVFERYVLLGKGPDIGKIQKVYDSAGDEIKLSKRSPIHEVDWSTAFNRDSNHHRV